MKNIYFDNIIFSLQHAGGISKYWSELIRRVVENHEDGFYFLERQNSNLFRQELSDIIPSERLLGSDKNRFPIWLDRYVDVSLRQDSSIFHSSYYRLSNNKTCLNITTVHDFTYELFASPLKKLCHSVQKRRAILNSEIIICVSENTKNDLFSFYPEIGEDRVYVVNNGVDVCYNPLTNQRILELKSFYDFHFDSFILYVGDRRAKYKNFNLVVKVALLSGTNLLIVGGGPLNSFEYDMLSKHLGKGKFRHELNVNSEKLNLIYNIAICLVYPSSYEGFGIPILEAQAAGCPVVASNSSSIPEIAGLGALMNDQLTVESLSDSVLVLMNDSDRRNDLIKKGLFNSKKYNWDRCYIETIGLYGLIS